MGTRRTGLGTMGLADALIKMKIAYGSAESVPVIERIYATIRDAAYEASADIAVEKGVFPRFERDKYMQGRFIKRLPKATQEKIKKQGIRNAVLLTQAQRGRRASSQASVQALSRSMTLRWCGATARANISCIIRCSRSGAINIPMSRRRTTSSRPTTWLRRSMCACRPRSSAIPILASARRSTRPTTIRSSRWRRCTGWPTRRAARA